MSALDHAAEHLTTFGLHIQRPDEGAITLGFRGRHRAYTVLCTMDGPLMKLVIPDLAVVPEHRYVDVVKLANALDASMVRWGAFWVGFTQRFLAFELAIPAADGRSRDDLSLALA